MDNDENTLDTLEELACTLKIFEKSLAERAKNEPKRRRKAYIKTLIIVIIVACIVSFIFSLLGLSPLEKFSCGILIGWATVRLCIWKFRL